MPVAGFYAQNPDTGTFLIDETFRSLAVRRKGTVTLGADGSGSVSWESPVMPMLAVRCTKEVAVFGGTVIFGGNLVWRLWGTPGAVVSYWLFDVPVPTGGTHGLQLYNAAGELTFDSSMQYARYAGIYFVDDVETTSPSYTLPAGKTYAVVLLKSGWQFETQVMDDGLPRSPQGNYYLRDRFNSGGCSINSNVLHFDWYDTRTFSEWSDHVYTAEDVFAHQTYGHYTVHALVLDVTGY
jgi:hypothetical protein